MTSRFVNKALKALVLIAEGLGGAEFAQGVLRACGLHPLVQPWLVRLCANNAGLRRRRGSRMVSNATPDGVLRLVVADSYLAGRQFAAALHHAEALIALAPEGFDGFHIASESLQQLGRPEEAISLLEQGLERCLAQGEMAAQGRSRHVQRHLQAYQKRHWFPLYSLWRAAVLAPHQPPDLTPPAVTSLQAPGDSVLESGCATG